MKTIHEGFTKVRKTNNNLKGWDHKSVFYAGASCALSILMSLNEESEAGAAGVLDGLRTETNAHFGIADGTAVAPNLHASKET